MDIEAKQQRSPTAVELAAVIKPFMDLALRDLNATYAVVPVDRNGVWAPGRPPSKDWFFYARIKLAPDAKVSLGALHSALDRFTVFEPELDEDGALVLPSTGEGVTLGDGDDSGAVGVDAEGVFVWVRLLDRLV